QKNVTLSLDLQKDIGAVEADPVRLKQIFFNLLNNAIKFNRDKGHVKLNVSKSDDGKWLVCEVRDTGIGIPKDKMPELFSEFFQVDSGYSRFSEGTGLGLALTRCLVNLHDGEITVESEEGVGSVFTFKIPVGS